MPDTAQKNSPVTDYDRDSIHTLPLSVVPIRNAALSKARLIKNHRLETRVELFRESGGGSGQISIDEVPDFFPTSDGSIDADLSLLRKIGELPAYDPYTLRMGLRQAGVDVLSLDALQLSDSKRSELQPLMRNITRPLVVHLFGSGETADDLDGLMRLIVSPDTPRVRAKIQQMAKALEVTMDDMPSMLEDYGDTYLALSYYRSYLQYALPVLDRVLEWMREVKSNSFLRSDANVQRSFKRVECLLIQLSASVTRRFDAFDRNNVVDWEKVTLAEFGRIKLLVTEHQRSLAQVLCGLTVKIYEWENRFPNAGGSPEKRADFVIADLKPELDTLWLAERAASQLVEVQGASAA